MLTRTIATTILVLIFFNNNSAYAQFFGPKNYEECILQNMKGTTSDVAAGQIVAACRSKFPVGQSKQELVKREQLEERAKKCSLGKVSAGDIIGFRIDHDRLNSRITRVLDNLKSFSYDGSRELIEMQNINRFGISQVQLGFTDAQKCPNEINSYKFMIYCGSNDTESGVSPSSFGKLNCMSLPQQAKGLGVCKIGFVPFYRRFKEDGFLEFMEENDFC